MRILLIEDDALLAEGLKTGLKQFGYLVDWFDSAEKAQAALHGEIYDVFLIDISLPGINGLEFLDRLRKAGNLTPVLILTARADVTDLVRGFDTGADDYLVKPYRLPEVAARLRALYRRGHAKSTSIITQNGLSMNSSTHVATLDGVTIDLTKREWEILEILLLASPSVVSKDTLIQKLMGWDKDVTLNNIEVHISRLRQKIGSNDVFIRTVRGIGYRIDQPSSQ